MELFASILVKLFGSTIANPINKNIHFVLVIVLEPLLGKFFSFLLCVDIKLRKLALRGIRIGCILFHNLLCIAILFCFLVYLCLLAQNMITMNKGTCFLGKPMNDS